MEKFTLMAGAAVVRALATSRWQDVRSAMTRELRSQDSQDWMDRLVAETRDRVDPARNTGDKEAEQRLVADWTWHLQTLVSTEPGIRHGLRRVVFDVLLPMLPRHEQEWVVRIQITASSDQVINHNFLSTRDHRLTR